MNYIPLEVPRRQRLCQKQGEPFQPGDAYFSRLDSKFERADFCPACWEKEEDKGVSSWSGKVPPKTVIEKNTDKLEKAFFILRSNLESDNPEDHREAYILAMFLHRKKWLALRDSFIRKGAEVNLYEVKSTEEMIEVPKIKLKAEDASLMQDKIRCKLT